MKRGLTIALSLLLLPQLGGDLHACCVGDSSPPCRAYWTASAVFIGTVTDISYVPSPSTGEGDSRMDWRNRITRFAVSQALRGSIGSQVEVVALESVPVEVILPNGRTALRTSTSGDCSYRFKPGETYIVYATRDENTFKGSLYVGFNRTRPLAQAADDLAFIRGLERAQPGSTLFGRIQRQDGSYIGNNETKPVGGAKVVIAGMGLTRTVSSDGDGRYGVNGLPPGIYRVRGLLDDHLTAVAERSVEVVDRGCAEVDFFTEADGRVAGMAVDHLGQPLPKLALDLAPVQQANEFYPRVFRASADGEGLYEFRGIPPGQYLLGIRLDAHHGAAQFPYRRFYYPGVSEPQLATLITIGEGEKLSGYYFRLPPPLSERKIEGTVVWPDGRPVQGADVLLTISEYVYNSPGGGAATDERGNFAITAFEGLTYWTKAYAHVKDSGRQMHCEPIDLPASGSLSGLTLVVASPSGSCSRCVRRQRGNDPKR